MEDSQQSTSSFSKVFGVLFSPGKTFQELAEKPSWLVPLVLAAVLSIAATAILMPMIDWEEVIIAQTEASGQEIPEDQMDMVMKFTVGSVWVFAILAPFIIYPLSAFVFWLIFKMMGSQMSFKQSLSTVLHGYTPLWLVGSLLMIPVVLAQGGVTMEQVQDSNFLLSNLGFLAGEETHPSLRSLLLSLDIFSFWVMSLLAIGYRIVARVSTGKATGVVVVLWLIWVLGKAGLQALG